MISLRCLDPAEEDFLVPKKINSRLTKEIAAETISALANYSISYSEDSIIIRNSLTPNKNLVIDRSDLSSSYKANLPPSVDEKHVKCFAIWGRVDILGVEFLVFVSKAQLVTEIAGYKVFGLSSAKFLTMSSAKYRTRQYERCWEQLRRTKQLLKTGFYFSYTYVLTKPYSNETSQVPTDSHSRIASDCFAWNLKALKSLLGDQPQNEFFVSIIQGFIGTMLIEGNSYSLISRRSFIMGGTRYNSRGIDNGGNVANFVETETIFQTKNSVFSLRQLRGSLPFYWEQPKSLKRSVQIHQSADINTEAFLKHLDLLEKLGFSHTLLLNLLSARRGGEQELTDYFVQLLERLKLTKEGCCSYEFLDFHGMTRETDFSAIDEHIMRICDQHKVDYSEWRVDLLEGKLASVRSQQTVVRTNCLDCLDRTNAVQTKIAFSSLCAFLANVGLRAGVSTDAFEQLARAESGWLALFRALWADNGDTISLIYAGTGATTSSVTRKGEKSNIASLFDHGFKTIARFYLNTFEDDFKQQVIDNLLAKRTSMLRLSLPEAERQGSYRLAFLSLSSCKNNGSIVVEQGFVARLLAQVKQAHLVIITIYLHTSRPVVLEGAGNFVLSSFGQLLRLNAHELGTLALVRHFSASKFEMLLLCRRGSEGGLKYFKAEQLRGSLVQKPLGCLATLIFEKVSLRVFCLRLCGGFWAKRSSAAFRDLLDQGLQYQEDLVVCMGPMEQRVEMGTFDKRYTVCLDRAMGSDADRQNRMVLLRARELSCTCVNEALESEGTDVHGQLTLNANVCVYTLSGGRV